MHQVFVKYIAFEARLKCATRARRSELTNLHGSGTAGFQALVRVQDVVLLLLQLWVLLGHRHQFAFHADDPFSGSRHAIGVHIFITRRPETPC